MAGQNTVDLRKTIERLREKARRKIPEAEVEDLVQDVMLVLVEPLREGRIDVLQAYAEGILRHKIYDFYEQRKEFLSSLDLHQSSGGEEPSPEQRVLWMRHLRVIQGMAEENKIDQALLFEHFGRGASLRKVASRLGVSAGVVNGRLFRFRRKIMQRVGNCFSVLLMSVLGLWGRVCRATPRTIFAHWAFVGGVAFVMFFSLRTQLSLFPVAKTEVEGSAGLRHRDPLPGVAERPGREPLDFVSPSQAAPVKKNLPTGVTREFSRVFWQTSGHGLRPNPLSTQRVFRTGLSSRSKALPDRSLTPKRWVKIGDFYYCAATRWERTKGRVGFPVLTLQRFHKDGTPLSRRLAGKEPVRQRRRPRKEDRFSSSPLGTITLVSAVGGKERAGHVLFGQRPSRKPSTKGVANFVASGAVVSGGSGIAYGHEHSGKSRLTPLPVETKEGFFSRRPSLVGKSPKAQLQSYTRSFCVVQDDRVYDCSGGHRQDISGQPDRGFSCRGVPLCDQLIGKGPSLLFTHGGLLVVLGSEGYYRLSKDGGRHWIDDASVPTPSIVLQEAALILRQEGSLWRLGSSGWRVMRQATAEVYEVQIHLEKEHIQVDDSAGFHFRDLWKDHISRQEMRAGGASVPQFRSRLLDKREGKKTLVHMEKEPFGKQLRKEEVLSSPLR